MKHANIETAAEDLQRKYVEVASAEGEKLYLYESEYSKEELAEFDAEKTKWIIRRAGSRYFLADSDSGEDARGYYCGYFDLEPKNAVFENGKPVGYYLCGGDLRYSGLSRSSFDVDRWGYPGDDPFVFVSAGHETHLFLFAEEGTHSAKDWDLLKRDPEKEYRSYIDF